MYLIINTADNQFISLILAKTATDFKVKKVLAVLKQSEKLLASVEKLLAENKIKLSQLSGLGVVSGPGGFTSLRIGVVTANTLAYALKIPVVGIKKSEHQDNKELVKKIVMKIEKQKGKFNLAKNIVVPFYGSEPNITKSIK